MLFFAGFPPITTPAGHARHLQRACQILVCVGFTGLVTLRGPASPGTMGAVLALLGLVMLAHERRLEPGEGGIALLFMALPLYYAFNMALTGWDATLLDKPGRLLLAFPIYLALSRCGVSAGAMHLGVVGGSLAAAAMAGYQVFVLGAERASGVMNPIPFGNYAFLLGVLACVAWVVAEPARRSQALAWSAGVALLAGVLASLASGTRGTWLAAPMLLGLLCGAMAGSRLRLSRRWILVGMGGLVLVAALGLAFNARSVGEFDSLQAVMQASPQDLVTMALGSVGVRLHLYRVGLDAFLAHPLLGIGLAQLSAYLAEGGAAGVVNPGVIHYTHLHSAVIDMLARGGVLGLLVLGVFVGGLIRYFAAGLRVEDPEARYFALAGLLAIVAAVTFSLTNVFFPAIVGTNVLVLTLAVPAGGLAWRLRLQRAAGGGGAAS